MTGDDMEIVNPDTKGVKGYIDSNNEIHNVHDCTFEGDHSKGLDLEDKCTICGKTLGDFIEEDFNPLKPHIPIIIEPGE